MVNGSSFPAKMIPWAEAPSVVQGSPQSQTQLSTGFLKMQENSGEKQALHESVQL